MDLLIILFICLFTIQSAAIQAASREEKEVEAKIAAGTYSPPSASPSLERVERLSSAPPPPPVVAPNVVVPMAAPSPPSIPSSFVNSNVAHRSSREHRRDHGHHRDSGSSHGHHGHMRDPMVGSSAGMIPPPAAHSSGSYSSARMSGDELGRRRERSPQVRDTGSSSSSSMSSSAAAAAAAAASAAAVNAAAAQIFAQMQKMTPQQQALFLSQSLGGLGPMTNPQAMLSLAPLLLGQFGLAGLGPPQTGSGSKSGSSSSQMTPEQIQQRMFLEMMTNPSIAGLGLPSQSGSASGSTSRSSSSHRDSSGYRNH